MVSSGMYAAVRALYRSQNAFCRFARLQGQRASKHVVFPVQAPHSRHRHKHWPSSCRSLVAVVCRTKKLIAFATRCSRYKDVLELVLPLEASTYRRLWWAIIYTPNMWLVLWRGSIQFHWASELQRACLPLARPIMGCKTPH